MNTSGEVADLMAKEAIQMTESAVKLTALGVKNLAAIVMALANDDGKTEGVAKLKQMLKTGKQLCIMQIKETDLKKFNAEAKNYGIMYRPVADKTNDNGLCDVIAFQDDIPRLNYIMEKLGYSATEHEIEPEVPEQTEVTSDNTKDENSKNRPSRAERTNENPHGNKSIAFEDTAKTDSGIKPSVRKKIEDIKADLEEKKKPAPEKEKAAAAAYLHLTGVKPTAKELAAIRTDDVRIALLRAALGSVADRAIIPMYDWLGLGAEAHLNTPGKLGGNWAWRAADGFAAKALAKTIHDECSVYCRV